MQMMQIHVILAPPAVSFNNQGQWCYKNYFPTPTLRMLLQRNKRNLHDCLTFKEDKHLESKDKDIYQLPQKNITQLSNMSDSPE